MNRRDLVQAVSTQTGVERKEVDAVLKGFTDVVTAVVSKGEAVSISGFAKFVKVDRPARMGRNPQTQQPVRIKASKKARITPLKGFKDAVVKTSLAPKLERGVWPPAPAAKAPAKKAAAAKKTAAQEDHGRQEDHGQEGAGPEDGGEEDHGQARRRQATRRQDGGGPQDHRPPRRRPRPTAAAATALPAAPASRHQGCGRSRPAAVDARRRPIRRQRPGSRKFRRECLHGACASGVLEAVLAATVVRERSTSSAPITIGVPTALSFEGFLPGQRATALSCALRADGQPRPGRGPRPARLLPGVGAVGPRRPGSTIRRATCSAPRSTPTTAPPAGRSAPPRRVLDVMVHTAPVPCAGAGRPGRRPRPRRPRPGPAHPPPTRGAWC